MTTPLLFVASDRREMEPWIARWENPRTTDLPVHWVRTGKWKGRDVIAIANGVGIPRATEAIMTVRQIAAGFSGICSIGTGGGLDPSLAIADIIVATAVTDGFNTWDALDPGGPAVRSGLIRSSRHIARTAAEKAKLQRSGAILVEMEAAGAARTAQELAVPFYCVRTVSDLVTETFFMDFERFLTPEGRFDVPSLVMGAMAHPLKAFPELVRLQQRTATAARQLGDFLAQCHF